jgi:preprotein translocase YajC subunit
MSLTFAYVLFFLVPQRQERRRTQMLHKQLKPGTHVVTIYGQHGTICNISESFIILQLDDGRIVEVIAQAIGSVEP